MNIAVVNQKGGVGKTTLAVHLAVWHLEQGKRVAFIDADGQSSSSRWLRAGKWPIKLITEDRADPILEAMKELPSTHDIIIADGPANLAESTRALLLVSDFAVIPCGVTVPELESTAETIRMLQNARNVRRGQGPSAIIVLTRMRQERFVLAREAREAARVLGLPVCDRVMCLREAIADAPGQRTAVWNMGKKANRAGNEMRDLFKELDQYARKKTIDHGGPDRRTAGVSPKRRYRRAVNG